MGFFQDLQQDLSRRENNELVVKPEEIDTEIEIVLYDETKNGSDDEEPDEIVSDVSGTDGIKKDDVVSEACEIEDVETDEIEELEEIEEVEISGQIEEADADESVQRSALMAPEKNETTTEDKKNASSKMKAVITQGMSIYGDLKTQDSVEIAGEIVGRVESGSEVRVVKKGVIVGNITAVNVVIAGSVKGDITATEKLTLEKSAVVLGNVRTKAVKISEGAVMEGSCTFGVKRENALQIFEKYATESV